MAAALHPSNTGPSIHTMFSGRTLEIDFNDNRYPTLPQARNPQRASALTFGTADRSGWESSSNTNDSFLPKRYESPAALDTAAKWTLEQRGHVEPVHSAAFADIQSLASQSQQSQEPQRSAVSYALPPGASRRVIERYSLDDNNQRAPSRTSEENRPQDNERTIASSNPRQITSQERSISTLSPTPRHPSSPAGGAGPASNTYSMSLSATPSYTPPVAPNHRAYAQQPTYITPPTTPVPIKTVYSPRPPQEEVCVECAMRDQDMADVDVTSPGVWERESDAAFEDLKRKELEDEANGLVTIDDPKRPRVKGGRLTEQNLKLWLSINPREPASRQQTLRTYIIAQRKLLEAEAVAHARAQREAKQFDDVMRDTYSQLRRSAYDTGNSSHPTDDTGGVRIKPPLSPSFPTHNAHARSHSREVTLLENGMIVEHVDVRKEEREARERKRKEERRARKSSRGSAMDVTSIISGNSLGPPLTDSGLGLKPYSRNSQASSPRPTSSLAAPHERSDLPRAYSQASFSDIHSMGSASPRRTRFFGFRNLSAAWRSQDSLAPSGISGSMANMHGVSLHAEAHTQHYGYSPADLSTPRRSRIWPSNELEKTNDSNHTRVDDKPKKKRGLAKIWGLVTGSSKNEPPSSREASQSLDRTEDDFPLTPPPPLSYLVNRGNTDLRPTNGRHGSTPSLASISSPKPTTSTSPGMSPSTGPSSILPSPTSSRLSGLDAEIVEAKTNPSFNHEDKENQYREDTVGKTQTSGTRNIHPVISEPDIRGRLTTQNTPIPPVPRLVNPALRPTSIISRDKSLPPLPGESGSRTPSTHALEPRPQTVYTYDPRQPPPGSGPAHDFLPPSASFRTGDNRRQSFGGLSSRPNLTVQTMPISSSQYASPSPRKPFGVRYDEFGLSRRSLGPLDQFRDHVLNQHTSTSVTKRKSKFFASWLGKKNNTHEQEDVDQNVVYQFPSIRQSGDGQDDSVTNGYATSTSRHSAFSISPAPRISVASRKALEERVAQDPKFVAYRYPSNDQRLDLLR